MSTLQPPLPREESALGQNRAKKGDQSYYYAHGENWNVPQNAKVLSGPGLVTGGPPRKIEPATGHELGGSDEDAAAAEALAELRSQIVRLEKELIDARGGGVGRISKYSWVDEEAKVKVYLEGIPALGQSNVERPSGAILHAESGVTVEFSVRACEVQVFTPMVEDSLAAPRRLAASLTFPHDVVPARCSYRVDREKGKITLVLRKKTETKTWSKVTVC